LQVGEITIPIGEQFKDAVRNFVDQRTP